METSQPLGERSAALVPARSPMQLLGAFLTNWLPALPLLFVALVLLVLPALALIIQSVRSDTGGFTLEYWGKVLSSSSDQRAISTSLQLGIVCATISLVIGGLVAWFVSRMVVLSRSVWMAALNVAANFGGIGLAFGYIATLGTVGMIPLAFQALGLPIKPPVSGSFWSLVLAYEYTNIPLFVLLTIPAMGVVRQEWWEAAQTSAATSWQFWRMIGLPILAPFLASSWLLIFTWSVGLYGLPFALSGAGQGKLRLITLQIGNALQASFSGPQRVAVLTVLLMVFAAISLATYRIVLRRAMRWFA